MSLDGYIADPSGEGDWIVNDPEIDFNEFFSRFDTLLIGRKTFDAMRKMGGGEARSRKGLCARPAERVDVLQTADDKEPV